MFRWQLISRSVLILTVTMGLCAQSVTTNKNYTYLALGDSISFGYSPLVTTPTPDEYTGYPEVVARAKSKSAVNASCPGETSGSFLDPNAPDNGCLSPGPQGQPPFKYTIGLHTNYTSTQAAFAVSELKRNKRINLVTLSIGGNDLLLVAQDCTPGPTFAACVGPKIGPMLASYAQNLAQILADIRGQEQHQARYTGKLILVKYYAINTDPLFTFAINELNKVMVQVGTPFGAKFADAFSTFQLVSALFQGDPCKARLLIRLPDNSCDVHPSPSGRDLIAATVLLADLGGISILGQTSTE